MKRDMQMQNIDPTHLSQRFAALEMLLKWSLDASPSCLGAHFFSACYRC